VGDTPVIDIQSLEFGWQRAETLLAIDAFRVQAGERVFLEGPSGSGKSTLLNLVGGVLLPRRGKVAVLGQSLVELSGSARDRFRADHVGFIFQQFNLLPWLGVVDNVVLPAIFSDVRRRRCGGDDRGVRARARELLGHLGMDRPEYLARPVTELSVGQQQRVAAARALLGAPELVVADEPTSALDTVHRAAFLQLLERECREAGSTLLFVSHDPGLATGFDRRIDLAALNGGPGSS
jgi:putative ABC transport system ATP-binding protein